jgi:hypothetical protein
MEQEAVFYLRWLGFTRRAFGDLKESLGLERQTILGAGHNGKNNIPKTAAQSCHGPERTVEKAGRVPESAGVAVIGLIMLLDRCGDLPRKTDHILEASRKSLSHLSEIALFLRQTSGAQGKKKQHAKYKTGHFDSHDTLRIL